MIIIIPNDDNTHTIHSIQQNNTQVRYSTGAKGAIQSKTVNEGASLTLGKATTPAAPAATAKVSTTTILRI